jgi:hypothetical protein
MDSERRRLRQGPRSGETTAGVPAAEPRQICLEQLAGTGGCVSAEERAVSTGSWSLDNLAAVGFPLGVALAPAIDLAFKQVGLARTLLLVAVALSATSLGIVSRCSATPRTAACGRLMIGRRILETELCRVGGRRWTRRAHADLGGLS